ncbi:MAG: transcriptional regulator FnrL [Pikeienuella sp.]
MKTGTESRVSCSSCPIRHRAVCARADEDELAQLEKIKTYRTFAAGEPIVWRGDQLRYVASVVVGVATLSKTLEDGRKQMVGLLLPGDFIGKPGRTEIDFDVTATTETTLCCFERKAFEHLIETTPHISQRLMEIALDELEAAREWMLLLGRKTAREKIATFIYMLVRRQNVDMLGEPKVALALPMTREEIANYLGLTLETISRQLSALRKDNVLRFSDRRNFEVVDMSALLAATGDDSDGGVMF